MELPRFGENKIYTSTISEQLFYTVRVKDNIVHIRYGDVDIGTEHLSIAKTTITDRRISQ